MPSFEIPADIFTRLSVFDSPKGSSNTFKTRKNISLYFKRRHLIIYNYQQFFFSFPSGYDSCAAALHENSDMMNKYTISIAGTSKTIKPICKLEENVPITVFTHDNSKSTLLIGFEAPGSYRKVLHYKQNISDMILFMKQAKSCKQLIKVECYASMLKKYAWIEDRNGFRLPYLADVPINGTGCTCGVLGTCTKNNTNCNCDANVRSLLKDEGYITNKDVLPITAVNFGDTGNSDEFINYMIGDVKCIFPSLARPGNIRLHLYIVH